MARRTDEIDNGAGRPTNRSRSTGGCRGTKKDDLEVPLIQRKQVQRRSGPRVLAAGRYIHVCASHLCGVRLDIQDGPIVEESIFGLELTSTAGSE